MSSEMIAPVQAPRLDTIVTDPESGEHRRRTDYAGTVWYGGRPQMMGAMVISKGGAAQITSPFWLPDSHRYEAAAAGDAQIQATASVQSATDLGQILDVGAALGEDPEDSAAMLVYMAVTAVARVPFGVAYRVTVICGADALLPATA